MNLIETPRFILSGNKSGAGKSIMAIGLSVAFRKRKVGLSCCVNSSDPIQAMVLKRLTRRYCRCVDANLLNNSQILTTLQQSSLGADLLMIEGHAGLFDGISPGSLKTSDAELAALTRTPVILLADAEGYGNSLAALIKGYAEFAQGFNIGGVIANKIEHVEPTDDDSSAGYNMKDKIYYDSALQGFGMEALLGAVPRTSKNFPALTDKFTQLKGSLSLPLQFFKDVGGLVENHIDIDAVYSIASGAPGLRLPDKDFEPEVRKTRVAVSEDNCFSIGFQDNLDLIKFYGGEIVSFSPLADEELPKRIGAVYLTGASIDTYAEELAKNRSIMSSIKDFADSGGVVFSEGAGSAYLCNEFEGSDPGTFVEGCGILSGRAFKEPSNFSYNEGASTDETILGPAGTYFKGVSLGEWRLDSKKLTNKALRFSASASNSFDEGFSPGAQALCTFMFPHFGSNPAIAKNIVEASQIVAKL